MRATTKNSLRRIRHQLGSFIGVMIIVGVAIGFYATMKSTAATYKTVGENYFSQNKMPSAILSADTITTDDEQRVGEVAGVTAVQRRALLEVKHGEKTLRLESYDTARPRVNIPHVYDGRLPQNADECLLHERYAKANHISVGQKITISTNQFSDSCTVVGLGTAPEHTYLAKNAATPIADPAEFGVLLVDTEFAERNHLPFDQLAILLSDDTNLNDVERALGTERIQQTTKRADIYSYEAFVADAGEFELFAYIFPIIFLIISAVVVYISQRRNVLRDRRQIGILKAMGLSNFQVLRQYLLYAVTIVIGGVVVAVALSAVAGPIVINQFKVMINVPHFVFDLPPANFVLPTVASLLVCLATTYLAVRSVVRIHPAEAMHAEPPVQGRNILLQQTFVWRLLSFNTRYSLKAALRNRGRFVAMVVGMIATMTLLVFSFGFRDSFYNITETYFNKIATYDLRVNLTMRPFDETPSWLGEADNSNKSLSAPVKLQAGDNTEDLPMSISDDSFAMYHLTDSSGQQPKLEDGVILPEFYANRLGVKVGDTIHIYTQDKSLDGRVRVDGLTDQMMNFSAIINYDTAERIGLKAKVYNTILLSSSRDDDDYKKEIERDTNVMSVGTRAEERASIRKFTGVFELYIIILVAFATLLGVATLYSISTISLLARQYEFILLRVMGYGRGDILRAYAKELLLQAVIAVPIGCALGYLVCMKTASEFGNDSIAFRGYVASPTYIIAALILLAVLTYVLLAAAHSLKRQNLPEGLKSREE